MKKLLIVLLALLMLTGCSNSAKYNVGVVQLMKHDALDAATNGFKDTLEKEFGKDVNVIVQDAAGESGNCNAIVTSFIADGVDLIMANATPALQTAANATVTNPIPVLGTSVTEYGVALDIDNFSGVIGTNVSGTSDLASLEDQAQMIIDLYPSAKNIGILYCTDEANSLYQKDKVSEYLKAKGVNTIIASFTDSNDIKLKADDLCSQVDALYIPTDNTCATNGTNIASAAEKYDIPIFAGEKDICKKTNAVATLSIDYYNLGVVTGEMAISILKGEADISKMEIKYDTNPIRMYNKEVAEHFNITIPDGYVAIED